MDDETKAEYENKSKEVRSELKRWENEWAQSHYGAKPGRQDIKGNPDIGELLDGPTDKYFSKTKVFMNLTGKIAQKYKEYSKFRDILSGKLPLPSKSESKPKKRKPEPRPAETPLKKTKYAETPSKQRSHGEDLMNSPAISRKLFSPAPVTSLGPTPQRDGRVLGLFDLLVEKELGTPSKPDKSRPDGTPSRSHVNVLSTPSKRTAMENHDLSTKLGRTPMSASKKQRLNMFATPMKNRRGSIDSKTPSSVSKLQFDTPAFLKRHSLPAVDENNMFTDPAPLRLPRKPLVRGLSEIVASLRRVEDDALDDDLEALREVENDASHVPMPKSPSIGIKPAPAVLEPDSQNRPALLGGFDTEEMYDSPVEDGVDRNGNPLPVFKKKGQKRTTRKTNMRPIMKKRPQTISHDQGAEGHSDGEEVMPETQAAAGPDGGFQDGNTSDGDRREAISKPNDGKKAKKSKTEGPVKKVARKVNELAHANFHRLKLKNHGAKGGPGFNSRFRRRR
ncbi:hypothetical protein QQS21_010759 [Conoideocrella luteorostrata]|uniref:DNA replication regulator SLD2 n=1 Tax=Conoideocrella luteorostrata TaxID=1105319 RepID=A0AAJ0FTW5_9HYPO|nr:hypothetical protein QQS21_010759 [Conoideocrella luteorostrata]